MSCIPIYEVKLVRHIREVSQPVECTRVHGPGARREPALRIPRWRRSRALRRDAVGHAESAHRHSHHRHRLARHLRGARGLQGRDPRQRRLHRPRTQPSERRSDSLATGQRSDPTARPCRQAARHRRHRSHHRRRESSVLQLAGAVRRRPASCGLSVTLRSSFMRTDGKRSRPRPPAASCSAMCRRTRGGASEEHAVAVFGRLKREGEPQQR